MVSAIETVGTPLRLLHLQILPQRLDPVGMLHGLAISTGQRGLSPPPSEGQSSLTLMIQNWPGLLSLPLCEQIIEEPSQADQATAPSILR